VYTEPHTLTMGQLSDDLEAVRDPSDRFHENAWDDLLHLVGVLRAWSGLREHDVLISA
jgi:hypothetical protein